MKIDLKLIVILILVLISGFFYFKWINASDDELARENKKLIGQIKDLDKQRDSLQVVKMKLEKDFNEIEKKVQERDLRIAKLNRDLQKSAEDLKKSEAALKAELAKMDSINAEINKIKQFPPKREGEDLKNSLTKKLNQK